MISGEAEHHSGSKENQPFLPDEDLRVLDSLARRFPDWLVLRNPRFNLPAPIAVAIIAAALLAAYLAPRYALNQRTGMILGGAILGIAGMVIVIKWRIIGLMALPVVSLMVPLAIGTGSKTGINAMVLFLGFLLGLWVLDMIAIKRQIRLFPYRPVIASLVFAVVAIVAFGFGQLPWFFMKPATLAAQFGGLLIFLMSIGAFLLVAHQIQSIDELKWLTWVFLGMGFIVFVLRLFPSSFRIVEKIFVRQAVLGATFFVWLVAIAASQALFNPKLAPRGRVFLGLLVVIFFYVTFEGDNSYWISGWLPPVIALVTVLLLGRPQWGLVAVVLGGLVLAYNYSQATNVFNEGDNTYSTLTRLEAWKIMLEIIKVNPVFGLGMANYYFYTPLFPILGYKIKFNSHNNYIDIVAQTGLVGLLCFLWLFGELWLLGWRMRNQVPEGFPRAYVIGALGGLVGTLALGALGDWVIPFVYNIGMEGFRASVFAFFFLGGLVALARLTNISPTKSAEETT